jgi:hypothetical protein
MKLRSFIPVAAAVMMVAGPAVAATTVHKTTHVKTTKTTKPAKVAKSK